jgi:hypothetical protein
LKSSATTLPSNPRHRNAPSAPERRKNLRKGAFSLSGCRDINKAALEHERVVWRNFRAAGNDARVGA